MFRTRLLCAVAAMFLYAVPSVAQSLVPLIQLSPQESASAKQLAATLKNARERSRKAEVDRDTFYNTYRAAHPDLFDVHFTADFRLAIAHNRAATTPELREALVVELSPTEKQRLESLSREIEDSKKALDRASNEWFSFEHQLAADHVGVSQGGMTVRLANGTQVNLPETWVNLAFSDDYHLAFPANF